MSSRSSNSASSESPESGHDELELINDGAYMPYDPTIEPLATPEQAAAYEQARLEEEEEEHELNSRFSGEKEVQSW